MELEFTASKYLNPKRKVVTSLLLEEDQQEAFNRKTADIYKVWEKEEVLVEEYMVDDAETIIVAYGTSARISKTAIKMLREQGIKIGLIRPITIYPFPYETLKKLDYNKVKNIVCVEISIPPQMVEDIKIAIGDKCQ